ncbi:hypothetical protein [Desulfonatronovibrio magnus]|uniref:hypothetical protein n=1 Tax=Desulfonatronovibrio magnus TaxID=698827 RepID=UPI0005EACBC6|nr:hypothetical protein [Desulfonatronovibrio magnus]
MYGIDSAFILIISPPNQPKRNDYDYNAENGFEKLACALIIACALVFTAFTPALADENYACRCKGIKFWILFVPSYGNCGNGFVDGSKGTVIRDIPREALSSYIPSGVIGQVTSGNSQCGYYPDSGWNCVEMSGSSIPDCINKMR